MNDSYLQLYMRAHNEIIGLSHDKLTAIFGNKVEAQPTVLVKMVFEEHSKIINEQNFIIEMVLDLANGGKFDMPKDADYFLAMINDTLSMTMGNLGPEGEARRETIIAVKNEILKRRDAQFDVKLEYVPRGRRIFRIRRKLAK